MSEQKESEESGKVIRFRVPENRNEEAALKLEAELEMAKSNLLPVFPIVRYLKKKCLNDEAFAELVMDERKTLDKCFSYVTDEVKKALNSNTGWLDDNEVYAYAETYFLTDKAVFERIAAEKAAAGKKRQEDVAKKRKEQEEKRKNAVKERRKTTQKRPVPQEPKTENAEESKMQEQLCLNV
ncbi:Cas9 inhibitor AcrIIA9 family protein [Anaerotignum faecicola]